MSAQRPALGAGRHEGAELVHVLSLARSPTRPLPRSLPPRLPLAPTYASSSSASTPPALPPPKMAAAGSARRCACVAYERESPVTVLAIRSKQLARGLRCCAGASSRARSRAATPAAPKHLPFRAVALQLQVHSSLRARLLRVELQARASCSRRCEKSRSTLGADAIVAHVQLFQLLAHQQCLGQCERALCADTVAAHVHRR